MSGEDISKLQVKYGVNAKDLLKRRLQSGPAKSAKFFDSADYMMEMADARAHPKPSDAPTTQPEASAVPAAQKRPSPEKKPGPAGLLGKRVKTAPSIVPPKIRELSATPVSTPTVTMTETTADEGDGLSSLGVPPVNLDPITKCPPPGSSPKSPIARAIADVQASASALARQMDQLRNRTPTVDASPDSSPVQSQTPSSQNGDKKFGTPTARAAAAFEGSKGSLEGSASSMNDSQEVKLRSRRRSVPHSAAPVA